MSDAYSAWCEDLAQQAYARRQKKIKKIRASRTYSQKKKEALKNAKTAKISIVKCCATCANRCNYDYMQICERCYAEIPGDINVCVCKKWKSCYKNENLAMVFNCDIMDGILERKEECDE